MILPFSRLTLAPGRRRVALAALAAALAVPATAQAEPSKEDMAKADTLFRDAQSLVQKGQYAEACAKFAESQQLDPANGTLLNLGLCHDKEGKTATAYRELQELALALSASKSADDRERVKIANERIKSLEKRLTRVTFDVSALPKETPLTLDGERTITDPSTPMTIDPGSHIVDAASRDPQKKSGKTLFEARDPGTTTVKLDPLEDVPAPQQETAGPPDQAAPPPKPTFWTGQRIGGVAALGVGVIGLGVGTIFGLDTFSKRDARDAHCQGTICDATGIGLHDQASSSATLSSIAFGAGAVALIVGTLLYVTGAPAAAKAATRNGPTQVRIGPSGVVVGGAF